MKQNERAELIGIRIPPTVLFREIARGWKVILLASVIFALLLGSYRYLKFKQQISTVEEADTSTVEVYEKAAAVAEKKLGTMTEYMAGSILCKINPYETAYAESTIFIRGDEDIAFQTSISLAFYATQKIDWTEFSEKHNTQAKYMKELVSVSGNNADSQFLIQIKHEDENSAEEMMKYLLQKLSDYDKELQTAVGEHAYSVMDWSTRTGYDSSLIGYSEDQFNRIDKLKTCIKDYKDKAKNAASSTVASPKASVIKYLIFGAALGFAGAVLFLLLLIFMRDRLLDPRELKALYGISSLAVFPHKKTSRKQFIVDKYIDSIGRDDAELIPTEERTGILAAKLELFAPGAKRFALIGDVGETELDALSVTLSKMIPDTEFLPAPALAKTAASVRNVCGADAVILVGTVNTSHFGVTDREMEQASELGRNIIGSIVL